MQEIAHVENSSYEQERRCHLLGALRHGVAALILPLALARLQWGQVLRTSQVWLPAVFLALLAHNMVPSCLHTFPTLQWPGCQCLQRGKNVSWALASALCFC
ncbi:RHEB like 1 [Rhinolophus ferrumequinum]|uniref:RHEB like 1 n=1 Tax=Rhinolophus ferrumequinum TaxID=59479 RepID=A0A7J7WT64_RHIFE|nr:RHEB like 1 [Rhinolophus ferrumequinum]